MLQYKTRYVPLSEADDEAKLLAECAAQASKEAVGKAFAAGLSIVILHEGKIVRKFPDGHMEPYVKPSPGKAL